jgi:predicted acylesterase/phospholipase RssA
MADVKKETDGPAPYSAAAFDYTLLPDYDNDFVNEDDFVQFAKALSAPENSPSSEDLTAAQPAPYTFITALNDWRPVHQRVRRRGKPKKAPRRGKDETREGIVYIILKWPLLIIVFGWLLVLSIAYALTRLYIYLYEHWVTWRGRRQRLRERLQSATSYEDWVKAAKELDSYLGNDAWKQADEYAYYDSRTIRKVRDQMRKLREKAESAENGTHNRTVTAANETVEDLRGLVEACLKNNFGGFENPRLYSETYYGTKNLVQDYVDELERSVSFLLRTLQLNQENKRAMFKHLTANFGRTALCLSGGATFAYYHFGVAKALLDARLLPEVITGTSGGALVAALLGTRTDEELKRLIVPALAHRITACHDDMLTWIKRWYRTGARFDSVDWARQCSWFTRGSMTFREAYERTGRILNVSCVPSDPHSPTILANYITAPDCVIWSAVLASAAVPGILNPVVLMKKTKHGTLVPYSFGHKWKDGSLRTDIPLKSLNLHFNVRFSIVSQVNPHINLFFFSSRGSVGRPVTHRRGRGWRGGFLGSALEQYIKLDLNKWLKVLRHLELLPRPLGQDWSEIWLQRFSGTITLWPKSTLSDFYYILSDPTPARLARMIHVGQQSAFPKLKFIANRAKLERLIQQGRHQFRSKGTRAEDSVDVFSEDDVQAILSRTTNQYAVSDSDSSDTGPSRSESPTHEPPALQNARHTLPKINAQQQPEKTQPESPSLGKRLSGWWTSLSPRDSSPHAQKRKTLLAAERPPEHHRPSSMYEFGLKERQPYHHSNGSWIRELRRQTRVFVDDELDPEDFPDGVENQDPAAFDDGDGEGSASAGADEGSGNVGLGVYDGLKG